MKKLTYIVIFFKLFLVTIVSSSNSTNLIFNPLFLDNALPTNEIRKLYQDKDGFLWIATYSGLVRYDGYNSVVYKVNNATQQQVLNNLVNVVVEGNDHHLWIGTHNGLYVLDKKIGKITKINFSVLSSCRIEAIIYSAANDLWVATNKGLFCKLHENEEFEYCVGDQWKLDPTDMKALLEDKEGYLWIATWESHLIRYDIQNRRPYHYSFIQELKSSHTIFQDKDDNIWIGTWGEGLVRLINPYDMRNVSYVNYRRFSDRISLLDNIIFAIAQDPVTGDLWIGSRSGLSILKDIEDVFSFSNYVPTDKIGSLPFNEINSIITTNEGLMWLGSLGGGVFSVNTKRALFNNDSLTEIFNEYGTRSVQTIFVDHNGLVWIGLTDFGLILYNPQNKRYQHYLDIPDFKDNSELRVINDIYLRPTTGEIYFGTWKGVCVLDPKNNKKHINVLSNKSGVHFDDDFVIKFLEDKNGNLWVGTRNGVGILRDDNTYMSLNSILCKNEPRLELMTVYDLKQDSDGFIWIATNNKGILRIKETTNGWITNNYSILNNSLPSEGAYCVLVDHLDRVWVGTEMGLMLYDRVENEFKPFEYEAYCHGRVVNNIIEDSNHRLLLTTDAGVIQLLLDSVNNVLFSHKFTKSDGLLDNYCNRNSFFIEANGDILLGGHHGVNKLSLDQLTNTVDSSRVVITDLRVFNKALSSFDDKTRNKISKYTIDFSQNIVLKYNQNNFEIVFSLLNYLNPRDNRFAYKLEGYDKDYIYPENMRNIANYNNLKSGVYTFYVRGANSNNVWSTETSVLKIEILPPPWKSWWAYLLYVFFLILANYLLSRVLLNRIKIRNAMRTLEINRKKAEEINHAKLQFFTNITHDLLTPLSVIMAAVEGLRKTNQDVREYEMVLNNAMRLTRLIQQILEFRKVENGNLKLRVSRGNISFFLQNCVTAFSPLFQKHEIIINVANNEEDIIGFFDPDKLDKIMYNLLSNATKYNKKDGKILVSISYSHNKSHVTISVADTGIGIDPTELKNIFQRYYDGGSHNKLSSSTGIGLSLIKSLVDLHHGTIEVDSVVGVGSTFTVCFPIDRTYYEESELDKNSIVTYNFIQEEDVEMTENLLLEQVDNFQDTEDVMKLLIVENDVELLYLLKKYFQQKYLVRTAISGEQGVEVLEVEGDIDMIISDVMMPGMDGFEFCNFVKEKFEFCHIPFILLTAKQHIDDVIHGYESGADGYIFKPINFTLLDTQIDNLYKKRKLLYNDFRKQLVFKANNFNYTTMDEKFIEQAIASVNAHIDDFDFDLTTFVREMNTSRSTLTNKLKTLTGMNPMGFVNNIRLNASVQILEDKHQTIRISELAYAVGFNDPKYFSSLFKKQFGVTPREYIKNKIEDS